MTFQDLVVLRVPLVRVWCLFQPLLILGNSEEVDALLALGDLRECVRESIFTRNVHTTYSNDGRHELHQKVRDLQQRREEVIQKVNEETFNVRTIVVLRTPTLKQTLRGAEKPTHLIRHYHELTVPQALDIRIILVVLETHDFLDTLDLLVLHDLVVLCLAHVQELATQREDTKVVTPNYAETSHRERLGGVTFS